MDIEILNTFLISSIENMFSFQNDNASNPRAKFVKTFLQEKHISSMTWQANSLSIIENL